MKGKTKLLTYFQMDFKNVDPNGGNVAKRNSKSMQFFFLEIIKIEPPNKVQSYFKKEMPSVPIKHHFSYLSLH
jgi:hypothetical protein